jgi:hypothetical protein
MVPFTGISFTAVADIPYRHDRSLLCFFVFQRSAIRGTLEGPQQCAGFKKLEGPQQCADLFFFNFSECHHVLLVASAVKNMASLSQLSN